MSMITVISTEEVGSWEYLVSFAVVLDLVGII